VRFAERELRPHAEPVTPSELREGSVYFALQFVDEELLIPSLEPVVFIGKDLNPGDVGHLYFQDMDSHRQGVRHQSAANSSAAQFYRQPEAEVRHIFEYERALEGLMACSLRRTRARVTRGDDH